MDGWRVGAGKVAESHERAGMESPCPRSFSRRRVGRYHAYSRGISMLRHMAQGVRHRVRGGCGRGWQWTWTGQCNVCHNSISCALYHVHQDLGSFWTTLAGKARSWSHSPKRAWQAGIKLWGGVAWGALRRYSSQGNWAGARAAPHSAGLGK